MSVANWLLLHDYPPTYKHVCSTSLVPIMLLKLPFWAMLQLCSNYAPYVSQYSPQIQHLNHKIMSISSLYVLIFQMLSRLSSQFPYNLAHI